MGTGVEVIGRGSGKKVANSLDRAVDERETSPYMKVHISHINYRLS